MNSGPTSFAALNVVHIHRNCVSKLSSLLVVAASIGSRGRGGG